MMRCQLRVADRAGLEESPFQACTMDRSLAANYNVAHGSKRGKTMTIGVISDTHGHAEFTREAVRVLEQFDIELVLHCGDIGSIDVVQVLSQWPCHYVLGNIDDERTLPALIAAAGQKCYGRFGSLLLQGRRIAWLHGDDTNLLEQTISGGEWDLVCHGHTHVPCCERRGRTLVLNPGALYRAKRHTAAIVGLPSLEATVLDV